MDKPDPPNPPQRFDSPRGPRFDWRDLNPRVLLNRHPSAVTIFAVVLLLISLAIILSQNHRQPRPRLFAYYFDLNTQRVFVDRSDLPVPFGRRENNYAYPEGPDGAAVRATIYTCGDPRDVRPGMTVQELGEVGAFINTLHRFTADRLEAERLLDQGEMPSVGEYTEDVWASGELVAEIDGVRWYPAESEAGRELLEAYMDQCDSGESPRICLP